MPGIYDMMLSGVDWQAFSHEPNGRTKMGDESMFPEEIKQEEEPSANRYTGELFAGKSFGVRAVAYIIDTIFMMAINYGMSIMFGIVVGIVGVASGREVVFDTESSSAACLSLFLSVLLVLTYFALFEGLYGASLGKLILSMRVVKEDGSPCNMGAALTRGLWRFIDAFIFGLVAYVTMDKPLQQRLGDKRAHTVVISKNDMLPGSKRDWPMFLIALAFFIAAELVVISINLFNQITFVSVNGITT
jgi:uncharacterized RDD family membrane protein YckC